MDFHHLGEFVFSRNVCVSRRKVPVFGTFSAYSASSAALRENPNEEPSIADMSLRKPTARASSLRSGFSAGVSLPLQDEQQGTFVEGGRQGAELPRLVEIARADPVGGTFHGLQANLVHRAGHP